MLPMDTAPAYSPTNSARGPLPPPLSTTAPRVFLTTATRQTRPFVVVWICTPLKINEGEHLVILGGCVRIFFGRMFRSSACFDTGLFGGGGVLFFCYRVVWVPCLLRYQPLSRQVVYKCFSDCADSAFSFCGWFPCCAEAFEFDLVLLADFCFCCLCCWCHSPNIFAKANVKELLPVFSFRSFRVSALPFVFNSF